MNTIKKLSLYLFIASFTVLYSCGANKEKDTDGTSAEETATKVRIKDIAFELFEHYITANGSIEAVNNAFVSPESPGQVKKIHVKEGQHVAEGQLLVSLNAGVIASSMKEAQTALELADTLFQKQKELWEKGIGSEVQFLQAKNAKESLEAKLQTLHVQLSMSEIKAPFSGVIDEIFVKEGELASPGMQVIQLVNLDKLKINAELSEAYLSKVKKGDMVKVFFPAYSEFPELNNLEIPVSRIGNVVHLDSRTFKVQLELNNINGKLKPNIISIIQINDYSNPEATVVPGHIVKDELTGGSTKKTFVFVAEENNGQFFARKRDVVLGYSYQGNTEIIKGLKPGDKVITEGYNTVTEGSIVEIVK